MKVCIDAQAAFAQRAGISRSVRGLVDALAALNEGDEFVPLYFSVRSATRMFAKATQVRVPIPRRALQAAWRVFRSPSFEKLAPRADVYHFPDFVLPPCGAGGPF